MDIHNNKDHQDHQELSHQLQEVLSLNFNHQVDYHVVQLNQVPPKHQDQGSHQEDHQDHRDLHLVDHHRHKDIMDKDHHRHNKDLDIHINNNLEDHKQDQDSEDLQGLQGLLHQVIDQEFQLAFQDLDTHHKVILKVHHHHKGMLKVHPKVHQDHHNIKVKDHHHHLMLKKDLLLFDLFFTFND